METIKEKYLRVRSYIKDGDIVLFSGRGLISNIIQNCDKSYYNHIGIVFEKHGALYIVDANENGVQADRLSFRINKYAPKGDFTVLKPTATAEDIKLALTKILKRSDGETIKYDFWNGFKELMNRKFGWKLLVKLNDNRDICSDYVSTYQVELKMVTSDFLNLKIAFPQDSIRYMSENVIIID